MKDKIIYIIPARVGSKGLPHKNRRLIQFTANAVKPLAKDNVYVTTDDEYIKSRYEKEFNIIDRPLELGSDEASMKDVLLHVKSILSPPDRTLLVCLYPTYPERTSADIRSAIEFFKEKKAKSMLCRKEYDGCSPFLMMFPIEVNGGKQVISHNLYRRQDYPEVFVLSHFIAIMRAGELPRLNLNLYNEQTVFMPIDDVIDVDTAEDLEQFEA